MLIAATIQSNRRGGYLTASTLSCSLLEGSRLIAGIIAILEFVGLQSANHHQLRRDGLRARPCWSSVGTVGVHGGGSITYTIYQ